MLLVPPAAVCVVLLCLSGASADKHEDTPTGSECPTQKCVCKPTLSLEWSPAAPGPCSNATFDWLLQTAMAKITVQAEELEVKTSEIQELQSALSSSKSEISSWESAKTDEEEKSQKLREDNERLQAELDATKQRTEELKQENRYLLKDYEELKFQKAKVSVRPLDCADVQRFGYQYSGIYTIYPAGLSNGGVDVFCDLNTDHGGWTVIQRRQDGSTSFERDWEEYKDGFGTLAKEFWLGNEYIHQISKQREYELRVDMTNFDGDKVYATYTSFSIDSEHDLYKLNIGNYDGTAGDALAHHRGYPFSTFDRDNDQSRSGNCSKLYGGGGWWYVRCYDANLNGLYLAGEKDKKSVVWFTWNRDHASLRQVDIKIRPKAFRG